MANFDSVGLQYKGYTHTTPGIMSIGEHTSRRVRRGGGGVSGGREGRTQSYGRGRIPNIVYHEKQIRKGRTMYIVKFVMSQLRDITTYPPHPFCPS